MLIFHCVDNQLESSENQTEQQQVDSSTEVATENPKDNKQRKFLSVAY